MTYIVYGDILDGILIHLLSQVNRDPKEVGYLSALSSTSMITIAYDPIEQLRSPPRDFETIRTILSVSSLIVRSEGTCQYRDMTR
jgi:hypothetical protein